MCVDLNIPGAREEIWELGSHSGSAERQKERNKLHNIFAISIFKYFVSTVFRNISILFITLVLAYECCGILETDLFRNAGCVLHAILVPAALAPHGTHFR